MKEANSRAKNRAPDLAPAHYVRLDKPLAAGDIKYAELELREPTGAELAACDDKQGWAYTIALVSEVTKITPRLIGELPARVLNECADYLTPFLESVRPTGPDA